MFTIAVGNLVVYSKGVNILIGVFYSLDVDDWRATTDYLCYNIYNRSHWSQDTVYSLFP